jgi:TRAP-type C4-dicarboxylate transport system permease small subunit|tara:strand:- start:1055 stop:1552 length:498 start_codon:yes stop_codon:yes gene_type:complete
MARIGYWGAACLAAIMMLHVSADVLSKYFLNAPIVATLEMVSNYYMVAIIFLPLGYVQQENRHVAFTLVTDMLRPRMRAIVGLAAAALSLVYLAAMIWSSFDEALYQTELRATINLNFTLPVWQARWIPPVGFALMALCILCQAIRAFVDAASARNADASPQSTN